LNCTAAQHKSRRAIKFNIVTLHEPFISGAIAEKDFRFLRELLSSQVNWRFSVPDEIITLKRYDQPMDAHLARGQLEVAGIDSVVVNDGLDNLSGYPVAISCMARLQIHADDRERAIEVLGLELPAPPAPKTECPHCGSSRVKRRYGLLPLLFFHFICGIWTGNFGGSRWRCMDCGGEW
jgi:hypothetical protein